MIQPRYKSLEEFVSALFKQKCPIIGDVSSNYKGRRPSGELEVTRRYKFENLNFTDQVVYDTINEMNDEEDHAVLSSFEETVRNVNPKVKIDRIETSYGARYTLSL